MLHNFTITGALKKPISIEFVFTLAGMVAMACWQSVDMGTAIWLDALRAWLCIANLLSVQQLLMSISINPKSLLLII